MIHIEKAQVFGWEAAIRGMRNPMNSWEKSDSFIGCEPDNYWPICGDDCRHKCQFVVGEEDLLLMKKLSKAGTDHSKFLRMINVTADVTAPLYFFKEYDTYKVSTVANSTSTMHKIHARDLTIDDFSCDHLQGEGLEALGKIIDTINTYRKRFIETKDKEDWYSMIQLLPSSYNQKRTVQLNYQVLKSIYHARNAHKLNEWHFFCSWAVTLPYFKEICVDM